MLQMLRHNSADKATLPFLLVELNTSEEELHAQGIEPLSLVAIYHDFIQRKEELADIARQTANQLLHAREVHAVRYRVKDPIHLLRKVIRKKAEYPDRIINQGNYLKWINDLAGIRVLHLYKESWSGIGHYIREVWELKRPPAAYIRKDDTGPFVRELTEAGCDIKLHQLGYRAVHFVIKTKPNKQSYFVEIQLRTLFEEAWSEIDHTIRYPDHVCSGFVRDLLSMLNRLTSHADDMATFIKSLSNRIQAHELSQQPGLWTEEEQAELKAQVEGLPLTAEEKQRLQAHIQHILKRGKSS
jgi:ppGpp synthetase/RelA/SpoT-type nucleotidyltranferase